MISFSPTREKRKTLKIFTPLVFIYEKRLAEFYQVYKYLVAVKRVQKFIVYYVHFNFQLQY